MLTTYHLVLTVHCCYFADDTKLFRCIKSNFDVVQLQADIDALLGLSKLWLLSFNISKCKHLRVGSDSCYVSYTFDGQAIESVDCLRDLGIIIDFILILTAVCSGLTVSCLLLLNLSLTEVLICLCKSLVRPVLEYGNLIWGPFYIHDQMQVEKVQRRAICLVSLLSDLPYIDCLSALNLPSQAYRHS